MSATNAVLDILSMQWSANFVKVPASHAQLMDAHHAYPPSTQPPTSTAPALFAISPTALIAQLMVNYVQPAEMASIFLQTITLALRLAQLIVKHAIITLVLNARNIITLMEIMFVHYA